MSALRKPLPFRGGAARLGSLLPSRSGVGRSPHTQPWDESPHPNPVSGKQSPGLFRSCWGMTDLKLLKGRDFKWT